MYGNGTASSDAIERDMNSLLHSSMFKHTSDGEFAKIKELISSDNQTQTQNQNQYQQRYDLGAQTENSLTRYRSAPSSFFADLLDDDDFFAPVEPEEKYFSRNQHQQQKFQSDSNGFLQYSSSSSTSMKLETEKTTGTQNVDLPQVSTAMYGGGSQQVSHLPPSNRNGSYTHNNLEISSTFRTMNSTSSNLIRQSSSPAGFLSYLNAENGFGSVREVEKSITSSRLNNHISFTSGTSSPMLLPQINENNNEESNSTFRSLKRSRDEDSHMFRSSLGTQLQNDISRHYTPSLVHHMSLPKTSSEMAVAEKLLRFEQELVPCKTRAKRGCATHPRSIAERERRTRISERMKKLQELFPNMDKQTSTADMLDLAVLYIKDLQKDLQTLKDARARCSCSSKQLETGSTT